MSTLVMVSARPEDEQFGQAVAKHAGFEFAKVDRATELRKILKEKKDVVLLWDIDHPEAIEISSPLSISNIGQAIRGVVPPEQVFVISTNPLNSTPYIFNLPVFSHHIYRQYKDPAALIVSFLVKACRQKSGCFGLQNYMPEGQAPKKLTIKHSRERRPVIEAIHKIMEKAGIPDQLNAIATQSVDEMLMNAIFDAPVRGSGGETYRRKVDRAAEFVLKEKEVVELEFGNCEGYYAICVRDQFGSLKKDTVLGFIRKDYEKTEYKIKENDPGAGLGVYGMLQSGLSIVFAARPNIKTEVMLFLPQVKGMKTFRSSFRFFSFI